MRNLVLALALFCSPVFAFGELGHQMVCSMAYQLLSPASQQKVQQLMQLHEQKDFTKACSWPDQIRSLPEYQHSKVWHYVNIQRTDAKVTMQHCPAEGCVLSAIEQQRQKLTPFAPSKQQLEALLFVGHFIADLHQPLHAGYADDLGGNKTAVYFEGEPSNLHAVWDSRILEAASYQNATKQQALYQALLQKQKQWQQVSVLDWANESVLLVKLIYQGYKPGMLIDQTYQQQHLPELEQRLQQAAVRLALVLEQSFTAASSAG
ncbi:S1/P1 nuclease [Rheinheimera sp.]|uniref:S1/P1 nuclease n=1 Tax=Rheinheimera sp. TaxID=1869214 RepID=UPI002605D6E4|nr:S1/P1 nuclease [Rheinheimera sp.]MCA1928302.1 S1/P1 nuclease [Rheinheimera sp.]